ncbi:MAG: terminase family protein [Acidobacteriia bacterium]|nr:terminase family protein [Terriglobia bacterium]
MGSLRFSEALPPVIELRPYQQLWIDDQSRFKGAVKSARIGYTFATAGEAVLDCLERENATWTTLSHSFPGAIEFIEKGAAPIIEAMGAVAQHSSELYADDLGATDIQVKRISFSNGSRILALAANPRTVRGYPGNAILDEFAHVKDSYLIWAGVTRQLALGHKLRIPSTPFGEVGKFFDLAHEFGLDQGIAPATNPVRVGPWSWHWTDVHMAIAQGCAIDLDEMRALYKGDNDTFAQEFLCVFLKAVGAWLSLELIAQAEDAGATVDWPAGYQPVGRLFLGVDVGRSGDRTMAWMDEHVGDVAWTRMVQRMHDVPFFERNEKHDQARLLEPWVRLAQRTAMDCTGIGLGLYEWLAAKHSGRVMGINFSGSVPKGANVPAHMAAASGAVKIKTDMAVRMKQRFEQGKNRIPHDLDIRQELQAIKREYSGGAVRFDAPRIEIDSASGSKNKAYAHAEAFWAKSLADLAASNGAISTELLSGNHRTLASELTRGRDYYAGGAARAAAGY